MLDYKICKELKDAGLPQDRSGNYYDEKGNECIGTIGKEGSYIPILEELIDACGDRLDGIRKTYKLNENKFKITGWEAWSFTDIKCYGKTAKIAVAKLVLKLKVK